jgi:hypothetical protein
MKRTLIILSLMVFFAVGLNAQNTNIDNLLSSGDWSTLFPKRAGILGSHPQGYTTDFYSYTNFRTAIDEMSDYFVSIRKKAGVAGQVVTVNRKSTGVSYEVSSASAYWQSHAGAESTIDVDFGDFINRDSQHNNKRELAAFLANATKETTGGWEAVGSGGTGDHSKWGLYYVEELSASSCYTASDANYPAVSGKCYSGRGPLQLSWNYNYGQASHFIYGDKNVLLDNPDAVANDGVLAFKTAIWFWMMPQCPKPSCHQVMHDLWIAASGDYSASLMYKKGFAHTNNIINGGLECRTSSSGAFTAKVVLRSQLYLHYLSGMGFSISDVALENTGDYTSSCYVSSSSAMTYYANCDVLTDVSSCSEPNLGPDQTICSDPILLNAGVTLSAGESISWFKNTVLLNGASAVNYSPSEAGTYKATITSEGCIRSDEVILTQGGSIQVSADNNGGFCSQFGPLNSTISVSGGNGNYNFYTVENGGSPIATGGTLIVDEELISFGQSQTYYVEESAGETAQIGPSTKITDNSNWVNISSDLGWNKISQIFTAHSTIKLESIDFYFGWIGDGNDHTLNVKVYEYGTANLVASKLFTYANWDDALWNGDGLNTVDLGFDLDAGQYELVTIESNILLWQTTGEPASDIGYGPWTSAGIATLDGAFAPDNPEWGIFKNYNQGTYNWKFSKGGGAGAASCGRVSVMVSHDCPDGYNEIGFGYLDVFPNPAEELINITLTNINSSDAIVELYNSVGKLVLFEELVGVTGDNAQIRVGDLEGGLYFLKLKSGNTNYSSRVIISK